jgi:hypothetical protein
MNIRCFLKGHKFDEIHKLKITKQPDKYVLINGGPIPEIHYYGMIDYLKEPDYSKPEIIIGYEYHFLCKYCGTSKIVNNSK